MIFFDFETFKYDWLLVTFDGTKFTRIENDRQKLIDYYCEHKSDLWVGYNVKGYDQYIIKAIILGINPKLVNDFIIGGRPGWAFSDEFKSIEFNIYDCMVFGKSLKQLESYMGVKVHETDVDFNIDRPLTDEEKELNYQYCHDDVYNTALVFQQTTDKFNAQLGLCKIAGESLSSMSKTQAQLSAKILQAERLTPKEWAEEFEFEFVECVKNYSYKHRDVLTFFESIRESKDDKARYDIDLYGVPHTFALGGLHGAVPNYFYEGSEKTKLVHADVGSMYPTIMINWGLLSRAVPDPKIYSDIRDLRLKYKHEKNPLQAPLKITLNGTYGQSGAGKLENGKYKVVSNLYDPRRMREVCINGQLMILQLIEDVCESLPSIKLVQSNTDGVIFVVDNAECDQFDKIVKVWEQRTRMTMEYDYATYMAQRDVNNYIAVFDNGKIERKGGAVKEPKILDNDLPIVSDAVVEYFINNVKPEDYIMKENKLMRFMKTYKLSSKYHHCEHNGEILTDKVYRVFASRSRKDGTVYKVKDGGNPEKFAGCPGHAKIVNSDIRELDVPTWLDRQWYVDEAYKRIKSFEGCE